LIYAGHKKSLKQRSSGFFSLKGVCQYPAPSRQILLEGAYWFFIVVCMFGLLGFFRCALGTLLLMLNPDDPVIIGIAFFTV